MSSGFDPQELMDIFLAEAEEQLVAMDEAVVELERDPTNRQAIEAIFRAAHTLKASAAAQDMEDIANLSHGLESVMEQIRDGQMSMVPATADLLLGCVDALREMTAAAGANRQHAADVQSLLSRLDELLCADERSRSGQPAQQSEVMSAEGHGGREGSRENTPFWRIALTPKPSCPMPAARAWLWLQRIASLGRILLTEPPEEELKRGELSTGKLVVVLETEAAREELMSEAEKLPEVAAAEVTRPRRSDLEALEGCLETAGDEPSTADGARGAVTVRVKVSHLDALMRLVGELVMCRARLMREVRSLGARAGEAEELRSAAEQLSAIVSELREEITKARLVPLEYTFSRFTRVVRDAARREGKQVRLEIRGGDTEVDRTVAEYIVDPLKHLLRNAVSHGIEPPSERQARGKPAEGTVVLAAKHLEGNILISVSDDGRGIDHEAVRKRAVERGLISPEQAQGLSDRETANLLFVSGFSTADEVSDVSGRGVGLDVVRKMVDDISGRIEVTTTPGKGTTFSLYVPLTLAIMPALIVGNNDLLYALPLSSVERIVRVRAEDTTTVKGRMAFNHLGRVLEIVDIGEIVGDDVPARQVLNTLVMRVGEDSIGVAVDCVLGEQEIVIKPLPQSVTQCPAITGLATIGEGEFVLLVDPTHLRAVLSGPPSVTRPSQGMLDA